MHSAAAQELDAAILDLRRAVMLAPKYAVAHSNLGLALQAKGDLEGANAAFAEAIDANPKPKSASALSGLGANLMMQGDVPGALICSGRRWPSIRRMAMRGFT